MTTASWRQADITINPRTGWQILASDLAPALDQAVRLGVLDGWWYIRKTVWRLRVRTNDAGYITVEALLDKLAADQRILLWYPNIYEPETNAFGGAEGMDCAHRLFHCDSRYLLARARQTSDAPAPLGWRETTAILCGVLIRAAGLDRYEQADVWAKVAEERPVELADPAIFDEHKSGALVGAMTRLLTVNPNGLSRPDGPLAGYGAWITAFERAGQDIAALAHNGQLRRGLRAVLAHHIIFHANRTGISVSELSTMAALAMIGTFGPAAVGVRPAGVTTDH